MKVSVGITTYNHEKYIARALDSVLMQKTDFDYEIVIGEDCSTDDTRAIILNYNKRHPGRFRLLLNERNLGGHGNGGQVHRACRGEYIAVLEGDDYWTSQDKLQKQVDFLDAHPGCSICFHNVRVVFEDGRKEPYDYCHPNQKQFSAVEDLLYSDFIPTSSTVYRNGLIPEIPAWISRLPMGDWPIHILNAQHGDIGYINEVMGVWYIHPGGASFGVIDDWQEQVWRLILFWDTMREHLRGKHRKILTRILRRFSDQTVTNYLGIGDEMNARKYALRAVARYRLLRPDLIEIALRSRLPFIIPYKILRCAKRAGRRVAKKYFRDGTFVRD